MGMALLLCDPGRASVPGDDHVPAGVIMYLLLCDPRRAPVPGVPGDDHVPADL